MLLNKELNSATARQFRGTTHGVGQYRISSILSQSVHNIRFIEGYLVPDHQEVVKYSYFEKGCREKAKKCTRQSREVIWDMINEY